MTQRTSRERFLPKQGGFKTRPYKSPDLCAASRKRGLSASARSEIGNAHAPTIKDLDIGRHRPIMELCTPLYGRSARYRGAPDDLDVTSERILVRANALRRAECDQSPDLR